MFSLVDNLMYWLGLWRVETPHWSKYLRRRFLDNLDVVFNTYKKNSKFGQHICVSTFYLIGNLTFMYYLIFFKQKWSSSMCAGILAVSVWYYECILSWYTIASIYIYEIFRQFEFVREPELMLRFLMLHVLRMEPLNHEKLIT